jgi:hypothetical protein
LCGDASDIDADLGPPRSSPTLFARSQLSLSSLTLFAYSFRLLSSATLFIVHCRYWHQTWMPIWGHPDLLARSDKWFIDRLSNASSHAAHQGYKGCRWGKMLGESNIYGLGKGDGTKPLQYWEVRTATVLLGILFTCSCRLDALCHGWNMCPLSVSLHAARCSSGSLGCFGHDQTVSNFSVPFAY